MNRQMDAAIATVRFGMGARPGEIRDAASDPRGWLAAQMANPAPATLDMKSLEPSHELVSQLQVAVRTDAIPGVVKLLRQVYRPQYVREAVVRTGQAITTTSSFHERWVHFWSDHFTVTGKKPVIVGLAGGFEREAIRPNVGGRFVDLLLAAVRHPVMILYLDNARSFGPNTPAARYRNGGLNENLAREVLELHTLGVDGGYDQADVRSLALMLTGWSLSPADGNGSGGRFHFHATAHEPGERHLMGIRYADDGVGQAEQALRDLAAHPATARNIARELARHFVSDTPSPDVVTSLSRTFTETAGDLQQLALALLDIQEAWAPLTKLKTPDELVVSTMRGVGANGSNEATLNALVELGQRPWMAPSPKGWPDTAEAWITPDRALRRVDFGAAVAERVATMPTDPVSRAREMMGELYGRDTITEISRAESPRQALALALSAPEFQRR
ncbi:MAG: DUF1800 domain-containing protein [Minwuia sp.]|nr:DUF1800 domain-containing protein [Minwuia sp.]